MDMFLGKKEIQIDNEKNTRLGAYFIVFIC